VDADDEIRRAWEAVAPSHGDVVERLIGRHREPHRRYHTVEHVATVVRHLRATATDPPAPELVAAALYHDAVYDPRSSTNEADSARLAVTELGRIGWDADRCAVVARLVEATARHDARDALEAALLDADLAILGAAPATYDRYAADVRDEYAHVTDDDWRIGRAAVLRSFLARPAIYATEVMRGTREAQARANLRRELDALAA
jgi:predicted metal-dependent HD superfamily phosphohydrolase